jgi:SAM-dependent methyltransferase
LLRAWHIHKEINLWAKNQIDDANILDAGFGFGQYSYYLYRLNPNWNIIGIDVKEEQVKDCNNFFNSIKANQKVKFQIGDLVKFVKPDTFNLIVCVDVMEHIEEDVKVFENYYKSLKNNGLLLISTPSDMGGSDSHEHGESFIDEHVRDGYNINEMDEKLRKAGFVKTEIRYNYGKPGKISWVLSMKIPLQLINLSKIFLILLPFYFIIAYPFAFILNTLDVRLKHKTGTGLIVKAWK